VFGVSLGLTAYTLGIRHAFDADHIAAIDNTTRKLMGEGKDSLAVGFFFSLGHSTIVVALGALVALGVSGIAGVLENEDSTLNLITGTWGPTVAGSFLILVGLLNLAVLLNIGKVAARMRRGELSEHDLEEQLQTRGVMSRFYKRATRSITAPWQMYPIGVMFGFGFDTATEIALLLLAGGAAASGLPFYAVMCLPILFAAGMTLFDTLNSILMNAAYGWAFDRPVRKIFYNFTVTSVSVLTALVIGSLSLAGVLVERLHLSGGVWDLIASIDLQYAGYAIVVLFIVIWAMSLAAWKFGDLERRWSAVLRD
jgi:high-affinity nickel-transport protein